MAIPLPTSEAYAELQCAFDHFNQALFEGANPACLITLQRERRTMGYFSPGRFVNTATGEAVDEIALNPGYWASCSIEETLSTLVHEMCHQWQHHFGTPGRRGYHNREWASKMEAIGLMPSSTGQPGGKRTGERMGDYIIEGGAFALACADLITTAYRLSWVDRFPCIPARERAPVYPLGDPLPDEAPPLPSSPAPESPGEAEQPPGSRWVEYPGSTAPGRSNRVKFRCPSCGSQAWGKPSLALLCGEPDCNAARLAPAE